MQKRTEGIILQTIPYLQKGMIRKVYTKKGLFSFFQKSHKKKHSTNNNAPVFAKVEILYEEKNSSLHTVQDLDVIDWKIQLRLEQKQLFGACAMAKALLDSQMPEKPSLLLYSLFTRYLEAFCHYTCYKVLERSFLLKLCLHEGCLHLDRTCFYCTKKAVGLDLGKSVCATHLPKNAIQFSSTQWNSILVMGKARKFSQLSACDEVENLDIILKKLSEQL